MPSLSHISIVGISIQWIVGSGLLREKGLRVFILTPIKWRESPEGLWIRLAAACGIERNDAHAQKGQGRPLQGPQSCLCRPPRMLAQCVEQSCHVGQIPVHDKLRVIRHGKDNLFSCYTYWKELGKRLARIYIIGSHHKKDTRTNPMFSIIFSINPQLLIALDYCK